jgi:nucleotide-binding universal stress UspA family protein
MGLDRIVVPLDGSATAEAVLPDVVRLVHRAEVELLLIHVAPSLDPLGYSPAAQQGKAYLRSVAGRLAAAGVSARGILMAGAPAAAVLRRTDKDDADLIAVTAWGGTGRADGALGSVAARLLRLSRVPILVRRPAPPDAGAPPADRTLRNVLLPLDGSDRALQALPVAVELCRRHAARLFLLRVCEPGDPEPDAPPAAWLRDVEVQAQDQGVAVTTAILGEGRAAPEILDVARFHLADLIVLATHGRRGAGRSVMGRVAEAVLRSSAVPLVMVRSAEEVGPPLSARPAVFSDAPSSASLPRTPAAAG